LIIKKIDINSILPIIIKIIIDILELVNKLLNSIFLKPYNSDDTVFVKVRIDNLNEFSKLMLSFTRTPESIKIEIKKYIKIKKEILIFSSFIFLSENNMYLLVILLGLTSFNTSIKEDFNKI
jgi:hypothetical protein